MTKELTEELTFQLLEVSSAIAALRQEILENEIGRIHIKEEIRNATIGSCNAQLIILQARQFALSRRQHCEDNAKEMIKDHTLEIYEYIDDVSKHNK